MKDGATALTEQATLALLEAAASGFTYDATGAGTLYVKVPGGPHDVTIALPLLRSTVAHRQRFSVES